MGTIRCDSLADFLDVIKGLVERGLTFTSDATKLTINLTGGH